jgi:collagenase-like PrtC family protease
MTGMLTMGPILFNWKADIWRDFYFKIADEAPIDTVYIGEVVCSKRAPFFESLYDEVASRLESAGKKVVFSTLSEIMIKRERKMTKDMCELEGYVVEANDVAALYHLRGKPHRIGPFINAYNEDTLEMLCRMGATHITLPPELPGRSIAVLGEKAKKLGLSLEVQIYGRVPLAISARCYHARAHGKVKDNCMYVCEQDPDGMKLDTIEDQPFLSINGVQTLSHTYLNLVHEMEDIYAHGVTSFRLSPHTHDMVAVTKIFRDVLDKAISPKEAEKRFEPLKLSAPFSNGFFHSAPGYKWVEPA